MSILIDLCDETWMSDSDLKKIIASDLPGVNIICGSADHQMPEVIMAVVIKTLDKNTLKNLPNLKLIQKVGAGVEKMVSSSDLPENIKISRMSSKVQAIEMAEYCLAEILAYQRRIRDYSNNQTQKVWEQYQPAKTREKTVCVLGLGLIGMQIAQMLKKFGFEVVGWSRTKKHISGIETYNEKDGLIKAISVADYTIGILPETKETSGLLNLEILKKFKKEAVLINIGRGSLIVEQDLLKVLDDGILQGATLDVVQKEPMPVEHPFWSHPKIVITPHVSGWNVDDAIVTIASNYRRIVANQPLLFQVDRGRGY